MKEYYVYILSNWTGDVLYTGVTNNLERRVWEHKNHRMPGFSDKYNIEKLVYFEQCPDVKDAIAREKQLKNWRRDKKLVLINKMNPEWNDLSDGWYKDPSIPLRFSRDDSK